MATFGNLTDRLANAFKNLRGKGKLSPADVDGTVREIRRALLDADVNLDVVKDFTGRVRERALSDEVSKALNPAQQVVQIVNEELVTILGGQQRRLQFAKTAPTVIMLAGLQGAGKTTLAGKLAKWLAADNHTPLLVAADLQRPNAVTQLQVVGQQAGVAVYAPEPGNVGDGSEAEPSKKAQGNPVKVAKDSIKFARDKQYDVVIVDNRRPPRRRRGAHEAGGRHPQGRRPRRGVVRARRHDRPGRRHHGQGVSGRRRLHGCRALQARRRRARRRGPLVASVTGRPILFASTGEGLDDFEPFYPDRMASRILDLGDILSLIEQAQKNFDEDEARKTAEKFATDSFTLEDFLAQMQQLKNMGSIKNMLGDAPGRARHETAARELRRERDRAHRGHHPLDDAQGAPAAEAAQRIAPPAHRRGSGTTVTEVNSLVNRFEQASKMMKTVAKGGVPQVPGMGPIPGARFAGKAKAQPQKKGSRSGNPAKRAAENAALAAGAFGQAGVGDRVGLRARRQGQGGADRRGTRLAAEFLGR